MKEVKELLIILGFDAHKADFKSFRVRRIKKIDKQQQDEAPTDQ